MKYLKTFENNNLIEHLINSIKADRLYKVKELIEKKGVDKNSNIGSHKSTPLMVAVSLHRKDIINYLISIDVNLDAQESYGGNTALMKAALNSLSHYDIVKILIEAGADWNIKNKSNKDFLDNMIFDARRKQLIKDYPEKYEEYLAKKEAEKYNL